MLRIRDGIEHAVVGIVFLINKLSVIKQEQLVGIPQVGVGLLLWVRRRGRGGGGGQGYGTLGCTAQVSERTKGTKT